MKPQPSQPVFIVNGRFLTQQLSGVQAFARSICRELLEVSGFFIIVPKDEPLVDDEFSSNIIRFGNWKGHLWEQLDLPAYLRKNEGVTLLNLCNTAPISVHNQVITIHDLAFMQNAAWFHTAFSTYYKFLIPHICRKSKAILTVSQTIKNELSVSQGIEAEKIFIIGNKVSKNLLKANPQQPAGLPVAKNDFFLMVGSDDPRKNFNFPQELFREGFHEKKLVIAGGSNRNFNTRKIKESKTDKILKTGFINDSELRWLYENAIGLINPSVYEGFGIPNLEAMAIGCPLACADIPVFREICGDAAYFFNPVEKESLKTALAKLLSNKPENNEQVNKGKVIFEEFQYADRTTTIFKALLK